jgi:hypothetical protein
MLGRRSTGLPGKLPVSRLVMTVFPSCCSDAKGSLVYVYLPSAFHFLMAAKPLGVAFVLHDGVLSETPSKGIAVTFISGEIGGDGFW